MDKREFIIKTLMKDDFIEYFSKKVDLEEEEESGRTVVEVSAENDNLLVIKNVDKKGTELNFFKSEKILSMRKRVDHIIFEKIREDKWVLHLIEMKSSVSSEKWIYIKGKFRASYLLTQGIAAMLEIPIYETVLYTTYDTVGFKNSETMPVSRRTGIGRRTFKAEWESGFAELDFGSMLKLRHEAVKVEKEGECLRGRIDINERKMHNIADF